MTSVERLFVIWRAPPADGTRHLVGELAGPDPYCFRYRPDVKVAEAAGFAGFPEFPLTDARYESPRLFTTFQQRIPSSRRPDLARLLEGWGLQESDTPLTVLARSGGFLLTDRLELAEFRTEADSLATPLGFRVAGQKYYDDPAAELPIGSRVLLRAEPSNAHDENAVEVLVHDRKLGYVPRQYSRLVAGHVARGTRLVGTTVGRMLVPGEAARWVVTVRAENARGC